MAKKKIYIDIGTLIGGIYRLLSVVFLAGITLSSFTGFCENPDVFSTKEKALDQEKLENLVRKIHNEKLRINCSLFPQKKQ